MFVNNGLISVKAPILLISRGIILTSGLFSRNSSSNFIIGEENIKIWSDEDDKKVNSCGGFISIKYSICR